MTFSLGISRLILMQFSTCVGQDVERLDVAVGYSGHRV